MPNLYALLCLLRSPFFPPLTLLTRSLTDTFLDLLPSYILHFYIILYSLIHSFTHSLIHSLSEQCSPDCSISSREGGRGRGRGSRRRRHTHVHRHRASEWGCEGVSECMRVCVCVSEWVRILARLHNYFECVVVSAWMYTYMHTLYIQLLTPSLTYSLTHLLTQPPCSHSAPTSEWVVSCQSSTRTRDGGWPFGWQQWGEELTTS